MLNARRNAHGPVMALVSLACRIPALDDGAPFREFGIGSQPLSFDDVSLRWQRLLLVLGSKGG